MFLGTLGLIDELQVPCFEDYLVFVFVVGFVLLFLVLFDLCWKLVITQVCFGCCDLTCLCWCAINGPLW